LYLQEKNGIMTKNKFVSALFFIALLVCSTQSAAGDKPAANAPVSQQIQGYAGSSNCRECHERFYKLWSTSMHGLAMQSYTPEFVRSRLTPQESDVVIGKFKYHADINEGVVIETGPKRKKKYRIEHILGGKNVYYFLTALKKGRLQTLPVAYDVNKKEWLDTAASGVRHIPGETLDRPVNWKAWPYTFNTACYGCHVSQLSTNYDLKTDTYHTMWTEPGINCETCHGSAIEHIKIAKATPKGQSPPDMKIIRTKTMTTEQRNHLCASCHAKAKSPLTLSYKPGERFFDNFDLVTLENPDYYADGRDLGENYTYTSWLMSPCAKSGKLDCMHCHTSSGRYRFKKDEDANKACLPCHKDRVKNATAHTHHQEGSTGNRCVSCHMPTTSFARMNRSDHSMLPPTPSATIQFKSPNACNNCHSDKDAAWADKLVREWHAKDYQAQVLYRAGLIDVARKRDWSRLENMLSYIRSKDRDEVFSASVIRLLMTSDDRRTQAVFLEAMKDPSPLIRAAAAEALSLRPTQESLQALVEATSDEYRLVRTRAAAGLAGYPQDRLAGEVRTRVEKAGKEYLDFIMVRPDQWTSHYNMGNYLLSRREYKAALASYGTALKFEHRAVMAMVNSSIVYAQMGRNDKAEESLRKALKTEPDNAAANFNMGLLKAEQEELKQAEKYLKTALQYDPQMARAAFNLCVITSRDRIDEAITWCQRASELRPDDPKYAYTLAFYLNQKGETDEALRILNDLIRNYPEYRDAQMFLREISTKKKKP
jgi:tetratricopeptide (TPR) repeat protein